MHAMKLTIRLDSGHHVFFSHLFHTWINNFHIIMLLISNNGEAVFTHNIFLFAFLAASSAWAFFRCARTFEQQMRCMNLLECKMPQQHSDAMMCDMHDSGLIDSS